MGISFIGNKGKCSLHDDAISLTMDSSNVVRYFSALTITMTAIYFIYPSPQQYVSSSTSVFFLHLVSFAAHFGAQIWVTFIAGFTMFFNLPRIMFGRVQSRLFPVYFATTLVLSCVTLVTFTIRKHDVEWTSTDAKEAIILTICVISTFINSFVMAPEIIKSLVTVFDLEKASGVAYLVGYADRTELKKNPDYIAHYRWFRVVHSVSGIANVVTLVCNLIYLYQLSCMYTSLDLKPKALFFD